MNNVQLKRKNYTGILALILEIVFSFEIFFYVDATKLVVYCRS